MDFVRFCKRYGEKNARSDNQMIHYSVPITEDTTLFLERFFKGVRPYQIVSFGQPVGLRYIKEDFVWEEYMTEYDCAFPAEPSFGKRVLIAWFDSLPPRLGEAV